MPTKPDTPSADGNAPAGDPALTEPCMWFAMCDSPAGGIITTPMGDIPACERCAEFALGAPVQAAVTR